VSVPLAPVNPEALVVPRGYSHGMKGSGEILFVAGQVGWDREGRMVSGGFVAQFAQALQNVMAVVTAAGGGPTSVARLVLYVTDKREYQARTREVGEAYRRIMGKHFPAMALVEVRGLLEDEARIEIEGVALL